MSEKKHLYIVSFGDSRKYRLEYQSKPDEDQLLHRPEPFVGIEKELNDYLRSLFPDESFAYFTSAKVEEVDWSHRAQYMEYPELDAKAVADIKAELKREVKDAEAVASLNSDAPYNAAAPRY